MHVLTFNVAIQMKRKQYKNSLMSNCLQEFEYAIVCFKFVRGLVATIKVFHSDI